MKHLGQGGDSGGGHYKRFNGYNVLSSILLHLMKPFSKRGTNEEICICLNLLKPRTLIFFSFLHISLVLLETER